VNLIHDPFLDPPRERPGCAVLTGLVLGFWLVLGALWPTETALALGGLLAAVLAVSVAVVTRDRMRARRDRHALISLLEEGRTARRSAL
jgi:hypothetical protein